MLHVLKVSHYTILRILEIECLLLPASFGNAPVDSLLSILEKTCKLFNHSVMTDYSANSALILWADAFCRKSSFVWCRLMSHVFQTFLVSVLQKCTWSLVNGLMMQDACMSFHFLFSATPILCNEWNMLYSVIERNLNITFLHISIAQVWSWKNIRNFKHCPTISLLCIRSVL